MVCLSFSVSFFSKIIAMSTAYSTIFTDWMYIFGQTNLIKRVVVFQISFFVKSWFMSFRIRAGQARGAGSGLTMILTLIGSFLCWCDNNQNHKVWKIQEDPWKCHFACKFEKLTLLILQRSSMVSGTLKMQMLPDLLGVAVDMLFILFHLFEIPTQWRFMCCFLGNASELDELFRLPWFNTMQTFEMRKC